MSGDHRNARRRPPSRRTRTYPEHDEVCERHAGVEQHDARDEQRYREPLLALVEPRRDECQTWKSTTGIARNRATKKVVLNGVRNGEATWVAISWRPARLPLAARRPSQDARANGARRSNDEHRDHRLHQPRPQLDKVRHQRPSASSLLLLLVGVRLIASLATRWILSRAWLRKQSGHLWFEPVSATLMVCGGRDG